MLSAIPAQHVDHAQHPDAAAGAHPARHGEQALQIRARRPQVGRSHTPQGKGLTHVSSLSGDSGVSVSRLRSPAGEVVPADYAWRRASGQPPACALADSSFSHRHNDPQLTAATRALPCRVCRHTIRGEEAKQKLPNFPMPPEVRAACLFFTTPVQCSQAALCC